MPPRAAALLINQVKSFRFGKLSKSCFGETVIHFSHKYVESKSVTEIAYKISALCTFHIKITFAI